MLDISCGVCYISPLTLGAAIMPQPNFFGRTSTLIRADFLSTVIRVDLRSKILSRRAGPQKHSEGRKMVDRKKGQHQQ